MERTQHTDRTGTASIRAIALALLVALSVVAAAPAGNAGTGAVGDVDGGATGAMDAGTPLTVGADGLAPTRIESCVTIDRPGTYALARSIEDADADTCIRIAASDVVLDGRGHGVDGVDGNEGSIGIHVSADRTLTNVTVRDVAVTGWDDGVVLGVAGRSGVEAGVVDGVTASGNGGAGLLVASGGDNVFRNNTVRNNAAGIRIVGSSDNTFRNTTLRDNAGWSVVAAPSADGASATANTFVNPDLGFENASVSFTVGDAALRPVAAGARPAPPAGKEDIGVYLNATNTSAGGYVDLAVGYGGAVESAVDESTLSVWRHDGAWSDRGGTLETGGNSLAKNVTSFSVFAPLADPAGSAGVSVTIEGTNEPVVEGEELTVTATVANGGEARATETVSLTVGGAERDATEVALGGGENRTVTLSWATGAGDAGNYTAAVATANDTAETDVTVEEPTDDGSGAADFDAADNVVTEELGDVAAVGVSLDATETATLTVGSEELGWRVRLTVTDGDGDGTATVLVNTDNVRQAGTVFSAAGEDGVSDVERLVGDRFDDPDRRIAATAYPMSVAVGGEETDVGTLSLQDPAAVERSVTISRARRVLSPDRVADRFGNRSGVVASSNDTATTVARGGWAVIRIEAAGIHGYVDDVEDLAGDGTEGVSLTIQETSTGPNEAAAVRVLDSQNFTLVREPVDDVLLVLARTDEAGFEVGETYRATFAIDESNPYVDATVTRSATFAVEQRSATVTPPEGDVPVPNSTGAVVSGSSTLANGTRLTVTLRSTGENVPNGQPFTRTKTVTTDENGDWSASFDFSEVPAGQAFTARVRSDADGSLMTERAGVLVENDPPTVSVESDPSSPSVGDAVEFSADATDRDGSVERYVWTVDGEVVAESRTLAYTFEAAGDHRVALTVTDDAGAEATASVTVTVSGANDPPTVEASADVESAGVGEAVTFSADATDPDGSVESYEWRVDGEVVSTARTFEHAFDSAGEHRVTVVVTDDDGATARSSAVVEVAAGPASPTVTDTGGAGDGVGTPGFGPAAGLVALAAAAAVLLRRRR